MKLMLIVLLTLVLISQRLHAQAVIDVEPLDATGLKKLAVALEKQTIEISSDERQQLLSAAETKNGLPADLSRRARETLKTENSEVPVLMLRMLQPYCKDQELFAEHANAFLAYSTNYQLAKRGNEDAAKRLHRLFRDTSLELEDARMIKTFSLNCGLNPRTDDVKAILSHLSSIPNRKRMNLGHVVPNLSLQDTEGQSVTLEQLRGNVVIIHFWATWCGPCMDQMGDLQKQLAKLPADRTEIYFVNLDFDKNAFLKEREKINIACKHIFDGLSIRSEIPTAFGVSQIPFDIVIDAEGRIASYRISEAAELVDASMIEK